MAMKASRPPTPAGRRTLTADTTAAAAVGGPVEASRRGGERRTEGRKIRGKVFIIYCDHEKKEVEEGE